MRAPPRTPAGFSLIEVMAALLVLGVGIAGLTEGLTAALRSSRDSQLQTAAGLYADGLIQELKAEGYLRDGTTDGECEGGLSPHKWRQTVSPTDLEGLHDVSLVVEDGRTGKTIFELRTLLFEAPGGSASTNSPGTGTSEGRRRERERERDRNRDRDRGGRR